MEVVDPDLAARSRDVLQPKTVRYGIIENTVERVPRREEERSDARVIRAELDNTLSERGIPHLVYVSELWMGI